MPPTTATTSSKAQQVHRVLVANRGEIAIRVLRSARELGWSTVAIYTKDDPSHATFADEAVELDDVAVYLDVEAIVRIATQTKCTHLHPGYGFLSENPSLAHALLSTSITFVGPSPHTLLIASDKMRSRDLATSLHVPVAPGSYVSSYSNVYTFAEGGYPVIIKALDGGGGRGIRLVDSKDSVVEAFDRCLGESPSRKLLVEKALTGPDWKHIEVQIVGDGSGDVMHLWERECSIQRRKS